MFLLHEIFVICHFALCVLLGVTTEIWISDGVSSTSWKTVDDVYAVNGPVQFLWKAKRVLKDGVYGGGDIALDDIKLEECGAPDLPVTTIAPVLRKSQSLCLCIYFTVCRR